MMFVESKPVIAKLVDQFPGAEMLGAGADGNLRLKCRPASG